MINAVIHALGLNFLLLPIVIFTGLIVADYLAGTVAFAYKTLLSRDDKSVDEGSLSFPGAN